MHWGAISCGMPFSSTPAAAAAAAATAAHSAARQPLRPVARHTQVKKSSKGKEKKLARKAVCGGLQEAQSALLPTAPAGRQHTCAPPCASLQDNERAAALAVRVKELNEASSAAAGDLLAALYPAFTRCACCTRSAAAGHPCAAMPAGRRCSHAEQQPSAPLPLCLQVRSQGPECGRALLRRRWFAVTAAGMGPRPHTHTHGGAWRLGGRAAAQALQLHQVRAAAIVALHPCCTPAPTCLPACLPTPLPQELYDACPDWGWSDAKKRAELADPAARFLFVFEQQPAAQAAAAPGAAQEQPAAPAAAPAAAAAAAPPLTAAAAAAALVNGPAAASGGLDGAAAAQPEGRPVAFVHFRYEAEEGQAVLYCYEIQVAAAVQVRCWATVGRQRACLRCGAAVGRLPAQRPLPCNGSIPHLAARPAPAGPPQGKGLGRFLMQLLELLGRRGSIDRLMLTVFHANTAATALYRRLGCGARLAASGVHCGVAFEGLWSCAAPPPCHLASTAACPAVPALRPQLRAGRGQPGCAGPRGRPHVRDPDKGAAAAQGYCHGPAQALCRQGERGGGVSATARGAVATCLLSAL